MFTNKAIPINQRIVFISYIIATGMDTRFMRILIEQQNLAKLVKHSNYYRMCAFLWLPDVKWDCYAYFQDERKTNLSK